MAAQPGSDDGVYVALIRGINVGGNRMLPMKDLVAMLVEAGCRDVKHYIQSGNVVFRAAAATAMRLPAALPTAIERRFGFAPVVMVRSSAELRAAMEANPFLKDGADENAVHLAFLSDAPKAESVAALDLAFAAPEDARVLGSEMYFFYPDGLGRAKLSYVMLEKKLAVSSTTRNWRTVQKLVAMCDELEAKE